MINTTMQQTILFFVQIFGLIFLFIYVVKTWEMASATRKAAEATEKTVAEMQLARDQETAPYIVVYFDIPTGSEIIYLVVKNIGRSIATQIKLTFIPTLRTSDNKPRMEDIGFIKDGIESMPPNHEIRTFFDVTHAYFNKSELPLKYNVKVSYYGGLQTNERKLEQVLDLAIYKGVAHIRHKTLDDVVKGLENLTREYREIRKAMNSLSTSLNQGVTLSNPSLLVSNLEPNTPNLSKMLVAKVREFEDAWVALSRQENPPLKEYGKLQTRALLVSNQLLVMVSNRPQNTSKDLLGQVFTIVELLYRFGHSKLFTAEDVNDLNDLIGSIVEEIKKLRNLTSVTN